MYSKDIVNKLSKYNHVRFNWIAGKGCATDLAGQTLLAREKNPGMHIPANLLRERGAEDVGGIGWGDRVYLLVVRSGIIHI